MNAPVQDWRLLPLTAALSLVVHAGVVGALMPAAIEVAEAGGGAVAAAALGNAFEDFTQGAAPVAPGPAARRSAPAVAQPSPLPQAAAPGTAPPTAAAPTLAVALPTASPLPLRATPVAPLPPSPATAAPTSAPDQPPATDEPPVVARMADADSPHPRPRPQPAGNSPQSARRGTSEGATGASAAPSTPARTASAPGNAEMSTYPGEVLRRIQRVPRARVSARGIAVVAFTVAETGALESVRIARASGSPQLDGAALDHIRRAAPFPAPPAGAQRQFSFEFAGR